MKVAVLWQAMSGYFNASLRALSQIPDLDLFLAYPTSAANAPFDEQAFAWIPRSYQWEGLPDEADLLVMLREFEPDAILVSSWHIGGYRKVLRSFPKSIRVLCMDNQWHERPRQWLGRLTRRYYLDPLYDLAFVPGDRAAQFARYLGFGHHRILRGLYCADTQAFAPECEDARLRSESFLFVGRLVEEKGVRQLLDAYRRYSATSAEPWPLTVAGAGPLAGLLENVAGVHTLGFTQPDHLPAVMGGAACLVLPSVFEPWGVVVHEAATAGLALVCSEAVGAADELLQDGLNGYIVPTDNPSELARAMARIASLSPDARAAMSHASRMLASQITLERWAHYLVEALTEEIALKAAFS